MTISDDDRYDDILEFVYAARYEELRQAFLRILAEVREETRAEAIGLPGGKAER